MHTAKKIGYFNHRVHGSLQKQVGCLTVTLVADKLERQWLREVLVWKSSCISQPKMQQPNLAYNHNTLTTLGTSVMESPAFVVTHPMVGPTCNIHRHFMVMQY